jgi:hypothetical protein
MAEVLFANRGSPVLRDFKEIAKTLSRLPILALAPKTPALFLESGHCATKTSLSGNDAIVLIKDGGRSRTKGVSYIKPNAGQ